MTTPSTTIVARATPAGRGGVGIVRISGPRVRTIAEAVLGSCPAPRVATLNTFTDADGQTDTSAAAFLVMGPAPQILTV